MYYNAALVLEGGAMRGCYTSGVLDYFLDRDIQFNCVIGVSAGSLAGANYVSKQYGRTFEINTEYRNDRDYISVKRLLKGKSIILTICLRIMEFHGTTTMKMPTICPIRTS